MKNIWERIQEAVDSNPPAKPEAKPQPKKQQLKLSDVIRSKPGEWPELSDTVSQYAKVLINQSDANVIEKVLKAFADEVESEIRK